MHDTHKQLVYKTLLISEISNEGPSNTTCDQIRKVSPKKYRQLAFVCIHGEIDDLHFESSDTLNACSTGVIISPNIVIDTRPHPCESCNYSVKITSNKSEKPDTVYQAELILHENYTTEGTGFVSPYNIALYKLNESITFESQIQPAKILEEGKVPQSGDIGTDVDWAILPNEGRVDTEINEVNLTVMSVQDCRKLFKHWYPASIRDSNSFFGFRPHVPEIQEMPEGFFCTKVPYYDFCLLRNSSPKFFIQNQLAGLLLWNDLTDDQLYHVSLYVDVGKHRDWIQNHVASNKFN
ncbi:hypothetical protein QAD02_023322 [Eretmocerus hayati]|uniref:Uncharacterized protein n=1 Tax=Eretmocerus hayati TaxID=131215 RepID=A0ACC2PWM5_9HYME|nr:hypothetical protein QAD02_023322 [Eretmocerus hayati]